MTVAQLPFWKSNQYQISDVNLLQQLQEKDQRLRIRITKLTTQLEKFTENYLKIKDKIPRRQEQLKECENRLRFYNGNPNSKNVQIYQKLLSRKADLRKKLEMFHEALEEIQPEKLIEQKQNELKELQNALASNQEQLSQNIARINF